MQRTESPKSWDPEHARNSFLILGTCKNNEVGMAVPYLPGTQTRSFLIP